MTTVTIGGKSVLKLKTEGADLTFTYPKGSRIVKPLTDLLSLYILSEGEAAARVWFEHQIRVIGE